VKEPTETSLKKPKKLPKVLKSSPYHSAHLAIVPTIVPATFDFIPPATLMSQPPPTNDFRFHPHTHHLLSYLVIWRTEMKDRLVSTHAKVQQLQNELDEEKAKGGGGEASSAMEEKVLPFCTALVVFLHRLSLFVAVDPHYILRVIVFKVKSLEGQLEEAKAKIQADADEAQAKNLALQRELEEITEKSKDSRGNSAPVDEKVACFHCCLLRWSPRSYRSLYFSQP
jgi:hypothetical protein